MCRGTPGQSLEHARLLTIKSDQSKGLNYGFVEYDDPGAAERAMSTLNGRRVHQSVSDIPYPVSTPHTYHTSHMFFLQSLHSFPKFAIARPNLQT